MSQIAGRKVISVGDYKFTGRRLGKGNFAMVEEATHTILNLKVAIKIMDVKKIQEEYVVRNLYREAKIMSKLSHPCIATLFQTMQHGNMYYIVTELVTGGDLCNYIRGQRFGKLEEQTARIFVRQLVSAISHMHNLGIVHRDLKMENVMLCPTNERIKIVDFGLSNLYSGNELLHTHCGSPEYAAPELFVEGKLYGPEVDLWSLGVILYGMVVGQLPFVSNMRDPGVNTQRRQKLLEQINKGLSPVHRKALALFTPDFKSMMGKLLVADSSKRINIGELVMHPWVTEKGRKAIRTNPIKKLDEISKNNIMKDVALITHMNFDEVGDSLKLEPHGNLAGMYNLLAHQKTLSHLDGDMVVTKNISSNNHNIPCSPTCRCLVDSNRYAKSPISSKRQEVTKSAPAPKGIKKPEPTKVSTYVARYSDTARYTNEGTPNKYNKHLSLRENLLRARKSIQNEPLSGLSKITKEIENVKAISPRNSLKAKQTDSSTAAAGDATRENELIDDMVYNSPPAYNTRSRKSKIDAMMEQAFAKSAPNGIIAKSNRNLNTLEPLDHRLSYSKGEQAAIDTHKSTSSPRPVKRRSMLPVMQMKKAPGSPVGVRKSAPLKNRLHEYAKYLPMEKHEDFKRSSTASNRIIDLTNEPIARSIAGYLTKNIGNAKISSLKRIKAGNANFGP